MTTQTNNNILFIVTGHSGSGKSSLMKKISEEVGLNELISVTTRDKRKDEVEGRDYYFIDRAKFNKMIENNELIEHTFYGGNYYGVTKQELVSKLMNNHSYVIVDHNGMRQFKHFYHSCSTIFLYTEKEIALTHMAKRGDNIENINLRLSTYEEEMRNKKHFDYVIKNNHLQFNNTKKILQAIVESETSLSMNT